MVPFPSFLVYITPGSTIQTSDRKRSRLVISKHHHIIQASPLLPELLVYQTFTMKYALPTLALAATALANPIPDVVAAAPPSFKIAKVISGGSGCPQGSIDIDYTDSKILPIRKLHFSIPPKPPPLNGPPPTHQTNPSNTFTGFSKDFTASVGPYVPADQSRKNCQINIDLKYSPGYQYAVYSADYTGWGDLDAGVKGLVKSNYYFSGETDQVCAYSIILPPFPIILFFCLGDICSLPFPIILIQIIIIIIMTNTQSRHQRPSPSPAPSQGNTPSTTTSRYPSGPPAAPKQCSM